MEMLEWWRALVNRGPAPGWSPTAELFTRAGKCPFFNRDLRLTAGSLAQKFEHLVARRIFNTYWYDRIITRLETRDINVMDANFPSVFHDQHLFADTKSDTETRFLHAHSDYPR